MLSGLDRYASVRRWSLTTPNPSADDVDDLVVAAMQHRPDAVIAVGGGSVLDAAKVAAAAIGSIRSETIAQLIQRGFKPDDRTVRLVLVPTTAGSGAEVTPFATVYVDGVKHSVAGSGLRADRIVLDHALLTSTGRMQRATSGFDAVAQAIESLWAVGADDGSRRDARWALALLLPAIRPFVGGDTDPRTARRMLLGSHLAGRAIARSRTTAAHALSYALTTDLGLPHGQAVGATLPALLRANSEARDDDLRVPPLVHRRAMYEVLSALGAADGVEGEALLLDLLRALGLRPLPAAAAQMLPALALDLAARVNVERLSNDPVKFDSARLAAVLREGGSDA